MKSANLAGAALDFPGSHLSSLESFGSLQTKGGRSGDCPPRLIDRTVSGSGVTAVPPSMMTFEGCSRSLCSAKLGNHYFPVNIINIMATSPHKPLH